MRSRSARLASGPRMAAAGSPVRWTRVKATSTTPSRTRTARISRWIRYAPTSRASAGDRDAGQVDHLVGPRGPALDPLRHAVDVGLVVEEDGRGVVDQLRRRLVVKHLALRAVALGAGLVDQAVDLGVLPVEAAVAAVEVQAEVVVGVGR